MNNTSEIETKPQTDSEVTGDNSVLSIDQQIEEVKTKIEYFKNQYDLAIALENEIFSQQFIDGDQIFIPRFSDSSSKIKNELKILQSILNSLEALKIKIDSNYDYHVVIISTHRMKHFITYLENIEKEERKEQNNG